MNPDDMHLVALKKDEPMPEGHTELPPDLWPAAMAKLAYGRMREARVSKHSGGKLSRWAAKERKARRKAAAGSRRRNRG